VAASCIRDTHCLYGAYSFRDLSDLCANPSYLGAQGSSSTSLSCVYQFHDVRTLEKPYLVSPNTTVSTTCPRLWTYSLRFASFLESSTCFFKSPLMSLSNIACDGTSSSLLSSSFLSSHGEHGSLQLRPYCTQAASENCLIGSQASVTRFPSS
jgi:hypothetical protein